MTDRCPKSDCRTPISSMQRIFCRFECPLNGESPSAFSVYADAKGFAPLAIGTQLADGECVTLSEGILLRLESLDLLNDVLGRHELWIDWHTPPEADAGQVRHLLARTLAGHFGTMAEGS